jgi:hypothetical protein
MRQTITPIEVIVVDNGSSDGSAEMVATEFPSCVLIRNENNRGFCAANNQGFAVARAPFFALLNNDAIAEPDWLSALLDVLQPRSSAAMAASKILVYEQRDKIDKAGHLIYPDGQNRGRGSGEIDHGQYDRVEEVAWPDGCAAMYRREMIEQIGGFDEDFFAYADDAELGLRARIAGWTCVYNPAAVVYHRRGQTLGTGSAARLRLIERNRILLAAKLFPWPLLLLNPFYFTIRLTAGVVASLRGRGETVRYPGCRGKLVMAAAILQGDLAALAMLPQTLAKRKEIERFRKLSPAEVWRLIERFRIPLRTLNEQSI